jgi:uncharacterized protein YndB with AHSA1/START domain
MKWLLVIVAVLVGLVVIMLVIGSLLPRDHVASSSLVLRQPRDTVWKVVRDFANTASWWGEVKSSQRTPDSAGRELWEQKLKHGTMRLIITEDVPPRRLVTTIDAPADAAFGGTWTYELSEAEGGTRLTLTERGYINNRLFRFMARFIFGYHATMEGYLEALGKRFGQ